MARFIALENIGDFKKGQDVPEDLALKWQAMYKVSPVQEMKETYKEKSEEPQNVVEAPKIAAKKSWGKKK